MSNSRPTLEAVIGLYPASFDPITIAHVSIAERAARLLDHLYVAVAINPVKKYMFELDKKMELVKQSIGHITNAEVISLGQGLTVDHARRLGATTMIRGARSVTDFLDEIDLHGQNLYVQQAINIDPTSETFVDTQTYYALPGQDHISSSLVRGLMTMPEVAERSARIQPLVPAPVFEEIVKILDTAR